MSIECTHGSLARACNQCEANAEIARLTRENKALRERLDIRIDYCEGQPTGYGEDAIDRLTRELEEARGDLKLAAGTTIEDALLVPRAALSQLRAERDEARQALEAERENFAALQHALVGNSGESAILKAESLRARVAELEGALNQILLILDKPAPDPGCHSWERFGQHMLTASRESEVIAYRALAAEGEEG